jgi:hypothetical protein
VAYLRTARASNYTVVWTTGRSANDNVAWNSGRRIPVPSDTANPVEAGIFSTDSFGFCTPHLRRAQDCHPGHTYEAFPNMNRRLFVGIRNSLSKRWPYSAAPHVHVCIVEGDSNRRCGWMVGVTFLIEWRP